MAEVEIAFQKPENIALVACASSGIVAVYADRLAARARDILVARRSDRLESLAEKLQADRGRTVDIVVADLSKEDDLARVDGPVRSHSALAIVVNMPASPQRALPQRSTRRYRRPDR